MSASGSSDGSVRRGSHFVRVSREAEVDVVVDPKCYSDRMKKKHGGDGQVARALSLALPPCSPGATNSSSNQLGDPFSVFLSPMKRTKYITCWRCLAVRPADAPSRGPPARQCAHTERHDQANGERLPDRRRDTTGRTERHNRTDRETGTPLAYVCVEASESAADTLGVGHNECAPLHFKEWLPFREASLMP